MRLIGDKKISEKLPEIEDLAGIFEIDAKMATKGMTQDEIVAAEKKAVEKGWLNRLK